MTPVAIRPLRADDHELLVEATLGNLNWLEERFTRSDVLTRTEFVRYTRLVPARGDFGLVANRNSETVGVAWLQFHPGSDAGYGFVDAETPEASLWVRDTERGKGIGRILIREAIGEARKRGLSRISLSVEPDNFAKHLYSTEGFVNVPGREADGVMLWNASR